MSDERPVCDDEDYAPAEDAEDFRALAEYAADPDLDPIPWEDVKLDLGLTDE